MEHVFDFLARLGEVGIGMVVLLLIVGTVLIFVIELIDFLIVDPINRNKTPDQALEEDD